MDKSDLRSLPHSTAFVPTVLLAIAVQFLIGGTARPLNVLLCFLAALPVLYFIIAGARRQPLFWWAWIALALYGLAWVQLVPLPPAVWINLAGRGLAAEVMSVAGVPIGWRPLALDPGAAAAALLTLAAPLILLVAAGRLSAEEHLVVLRAIVALALLTAILGLVQRITGGLNLYDVDHAGFATGLFANRNHHASFLACGIALLPAIRIAAPGRAGLLVPAATGVILFAGILATTSRAGIFLGTAALIASAVLVARPAPRTMFAAAAMFALAGLLLLQVPALAPVFDRFATLGEDQRLTMAEGSLAAAQSFFPWGSGWGSFVPVYMAFEDLDTMAGRYVVAAHNDYLQLIVEGGLLGLTVAVAGPALLIAAAVRNWKIGAGPHGWALWCAAATLLVHSAVDFPLRTSALATLLAITFAAQENRSSALPPRGALA